MSKLLELLEKLVRAIFGPGDERDTGEATPAPAVPEAEAVTGWEGGPPYRYIDVSRYQGLIDWAQVAAAGYKGAMLRAVSTNRKLSKRADGLYIDPTFETNYRNAKAAGLDVGVYYYTNATSEAMADAGGTSGLPTTPARRRRCGSSTTPTNTPARAACRVSRAT